MSALSLVKGIDRVGFAVAKPEYPEKAAALRRKIGVT